MARTAEHIRKRKLARDEEFREKLAAGIRISQLVEIYTELKEIGMDRKGEVVDNMANARVGALKAAAEIQFKALNKIIPDLKAVEHSGTIEHEHRGKAELEAALKERGIEPEKLRLVG